MSDDDTELRDTGKAKKYGEDGGKAYMSSARAFDTLVTANLALIRMLRWALAIFIACGLLVSVVTVSSALSLRAGQHQTRELIRTLDHLNCQEKETFR